MQRFVGVFALLLTAGCTGDLPPKPVPLATLFEKGIYQAIYGPDGRILRLLTDKNGDRMADTVVTYRAGRVVTVETDEDQDGVIDRWDVFSPRGFLEKVGYSHGKRTQPDEWDHVSLAGKVVRRELNEDGDGRFERTEIYSASGLTEVELDTNRDGRVDRWQWWEAGRLTAEHLDTDGDGTADRRIEYDPSGNPRKLERLGAR